VLYESDVSLDFTFAGEDVRVNFPKAALSEQTKGLNRLNNVVFVSVCSCSAATEMLMSNNDLRRKWNSAVEWLHEELERVKPSMLWLLCKVELVVGTDATMSLMSRINK
jgi:hypothetical protein